MSVTTLRLARMAAAMRFERQSGDPPCRLGSEESEYVDIDAAIAQNEDEESVELVGPHIVEDGALFFTVLWSSGEETWEPLENLMDKDGTLTEKLVVYADSRAPKLDLAPYVKILVRILNGKRDIVSDSSES